MKPSLLRPVGDYECYHLLRLAKMVLEGGTIEEKTSARAIFFVDRELVGQDDLKGGTGEEKLARMISFINQKLVDRAIIKKGTAGKRRRRLARSLSTRS